MLWTCFVLWLYIHGLWLIFLDTLFSSFPLLLFGSLSLFIAYYYMKLPPPDENLVEDLLGRDPWLEGDDFCVPNGDAVSESDDSIERKESFCMRVIAHRGAGLDAPENSLSAFRKGKRGRWDGGKGRCKERGCTAVEFDVALTADGVPVIFHDAFVDRVTDSSGLLSSKTLEEVKKLDISAKHPFRASEPLLK
ncbi:hypothetical protein J437_LFUL002376 [Ladona fulva]|uniref:GP-PDE domain-containing protein n=1 Tax=Ladona fulva TaxID=123851 RepID=A0A8K0K4E8_LADFU|nr:hypothetical protein J437_LFUL002376 [Ladona fulva]